MTRAEEYEQAVAEARKDEPLEYIPMPSTVGTPKEFRWGLRRVDLEAWLFSGRLPQSLLDQGMKAWREMGIVPNVAKPPTMSDEEFGDSVIFMREVVREACVDPPITIVDGAVSPKMEWKDFLFIFQWATGGAGVDGLRTFRTGQERGTPGSGAHVKKQRRPRKQTVPG